VPRRTDIVPMTVPIAELAGKLDAERLRVGLAPPAPNFPNGRKAIAFYSLRSRNDRYRRARLDTEVFRRERTKRQTGSCCCAANPRRTLDLEHDANIFRGRAKCC